MKAKTNVNDNVNINNNVDNVDKLISKLNSLWINDNEFIQAVEKLIKQRAQHYVDNGNKAFILGSKFTNLEKTFKDNAKTIVDKERIDVELINYPVNLLGALYKFDSFESLINNATAYVIAHSLLPKARDVRKERYSKAEKDKNQPNLSTIQLSFELPKKRGSKVDKPLNIDKSKLDNNELEKFKELAEKLGLKVS